jgi:putative sugar O-methyltransferase
MFDTLLALIQKEQTKLIQIYLKEKEQKGEGILAILKDNNKADIRYYAPDKLPYEDISKEYQEKKELKGDKIKVKDKWIVTMPILEIETDKATVIPVWNLILDDGKHHAFFQGFPQEVKLPNGDFGLQYVLVAEPHVSNISENNWTVEATTSGQKYLQVCNDSSQKVHRFLTFRSDSNFCRIVVPGKKEDGEKILKRVSSNPDIVKNMEDFRKNDTIGGPMVYNYQKYGYFSPNTLRYVNTLYELKEYFGNIDDLSIVEFGGGYGGLCNVMSNSVKWKKYTFVEIKETLELAKKVFLNSKVENVSCVLPGEVDPEEKYDLFISEFGFCELNEEGVDKYIHILKNSKRAYLSMNLWDANKKKALKERLMKIFTKVDEYPVYIKSEWGDYLWICT